MSGKKRILVTGAAGFIGYHTCKELTELDDVDCVIGVDSLAYPKEHEGHQRERLYLLKQLPKFFMDYSSITHPREMSRIFSLFRPTHVIHLAAQSNVIESNKRFYSYTSTNVLGFQIIAAMCLKHKVERLVFASSAAVEDHVLPRNIYASSKLANEHHASILANNDTRMTALRFFNVYGPYSRPDSAIYKFATQIKNAELISLYNNGKNSRDFIYIDDVVSANIQAVFSENFKGDFHLFEVGTGKSFSVNYVIEKLSKYMGKGALCKAERYRAEEIEHSRAFISNTIDGLYWRPTIEIDVGLKKFVDWFNGVSK